MAAIPTSRVAWRPGYRIIPSRFPPVGLFDKVADPADLDAIYAIEALTNDRLRAETGDISLVAPEDRVTGPGTTPVMAAFTHPKPGGDRFSDGSYGVFYASRTLATAIAETCHHRARFLAATAEPAQDVDMRCYAVDVDADLADLRDLQAERPELYDPRDYAAPQALARQLREAGGDGLVYASVRDPGGECAALFRPRLLSQCRQERHLCYVWDGRAIVTVYEKRALD